MDVRSIWFEQCQAARGIEDEFGVPNAIEYLVGEKFINFLEAADGDGEFRAELPAFAAEMEREVELRRNAADLLLLERAKEWLLEE